MSLTDKVATDISWAPTGVSGDDTEFLDEIKGDAGVLAESMDITVDSHVKRVFQAAIERFDAIDVIVNNAGMRRCVRTAARCPISQRRPRSRR